MAKRKRRKRAELERIQEGLVESIRREGDASVSQLIAMNGSKLGLKSTPNDKNLVKRLLNAVDGVEMEKRGRELYFVSRIEAPPAADAEAPAAPEPASEPVTEVGAEPEPEAVAAPEAPEPEPVVVAEPEPEPRPEPRPEPVAVAEPVAEPEPEPETPPAPEAPAPAASLPPELQALRAYARQLEEFADALKNQVSTLVRMIEKVGS